MTNKRRMTLIIISVTVGTGLSALLILSRKDTLDITDYSTLIFNMLFALLIIFGVGYMIRKQKSRSDPK